MYISQVGIESDNRRKMKDLPHLGSYHNWVESSFPTEIEKNIRTRKLWRIDSINGKQFLLVVSREKPDLPLLEKYGKEGTAQTKQYSRFLENLKNGQRARFKITLNPVVAVNEEKGKRGRIKPHITETQQEQFLLTRSSKNGFSLNKEEFKITERSFFPLKRKEGRTINLSKVTYEGILTITDIELFRSTLTNGMGKKKAYGCGLMTIIPIE